MHLSDEKLTANRNNAQKSTGPKTPEGKIRSSLNATRHGLCGRTVVLPSEEMSTYLAFRERWFSELSPQGIFEEELLQTVVDCKWRLNRVVTSEEGIHARGFQRLVDIVDTGHPAVDEAISAGLTAEQSARTLDSLSRHESRIMRHFFAAMHELEQLQALRKQRESEAREQALEIHKLHKMLEKTYDPRAFGFVLTVPEIESAERAADVAVQVQMAKKARYNKVDFLLMASGGVN